MSTCNGAVDVAGFVVDDMAPEEHHKLEAHIASCRRCGIRLARLRSVERLIVGAPVGPEPPAELEDHVFELVARDAVARAAARAALAPDPPADLEARTFARVSADVERRRLEPAIPLRARRRRPSTVLAPVLAAAAAVLAIFLLDSRGVVDVGFGPPPRGHEVQRIALSGPQGSSEATLEHYAHDNFRIEIDTEGMPLHARGFHYEVWLVGDGRELAVGSFRYLEPFTARGFVVTFNVGVDPKDYPRVLLTREADGGDPGRSKDVVMSGTIDPRLVDPYPE